MSKLALALVSLVAAPAAVGVGYWHGKTGEPEIVSPALRVNAPLIGKPGQGAAEAGKYFAALNAPPPPPPPPAPIPPPPPPDVAVLFRRDVAAVLTSPADPRVVLRGARSLRPGEVYQDGWKLASVNASTATLTKGKDQRTIGIFTLPPGAATTATAAPPPVSPPSFALTNGNKPGKPNAGQISAIVNAARAVGMNQAQIDAMSRSLSDGRFDANAATNIVSQAARNPQANQQTIRNLANAFATAGVMQQRQADQSLATALQIQSSQAAQQVMQAGQQGNRGPNNNGGRGPNGGFGGPPGGRGGPNGGRGLNAPTPPLVAAPVTR